ncbi:MAG: hypothetical protein DHS20C21_21820 [Gemmatimonadota bacterium]|nr:MAG: hypothetical protein DHS20C21_21820 [Gemmatimonadota bacterium]
MSMQAYQRFSPESKEGPYRVHDYLQLTGDEERCELLYGHFYLSPAPSVVHQLVVGAIAQRLRDAARLTGAMAVESPIDVLLSDHTVVQPDVVYIAREQLGIVTRERIEGSPDLIVEVLSPRTSRRDRIEKMELYRKAGVPEYWLIDPAACTFEFLDLRGEHPVIRLAQDNRYESECLTGIQLDINGFWQEIDEILARMEPQE